MPDLNLDELERLEKEATPGPWEFRSGNDSSGDSIDLLMAEIGIASEDEDPEYAEVFFGSELGGRELSANWELTRSLRNAAPELLRLVRRLEKIETAAKEARLDANCWCESCSMCQLFAEIGV